jgi:hypothetical protein
VEDALTAPPLHSTCRGRLAIFFSLLEVGSGAATVSRGLHGLGFCTSINRDKQCWATWPGFYESYAPPKRPLMGISTFWNSNKLVGELAPQPATHGKCCLLVHDPCQRNPGSVSEPAAMIDADEPSVSPDPPIVWVSDPSLYQHGSLALFCLVPLRVVPPCLQVDSWSCCALYCDVSEYQFHTCTCACMWHVCFFTSMCACASARLPLTGCSYV